MATRHLLALRQGLSTCDAAAEVVLLHVAKMVFAAGVAARTRRRHVHIGFARRFCGTLPAGSGGGGTLYVLLQRHLRLLRAPRRRGRAVAAVGGRQFAPPLRVDGARAREHELRLRRPGLWDRRPGLGGRAFRHALSTCATARRFATLGMQSAPIVQVALEPGS